METITATHEGRVYELTEDKRELPAVRALMRANGWDGRIWHGISKPVGRQRKTFAASFQCSARTGEMVCVVRV